MDNQDYSRVSAFNCFACSEEGEALDREIHAIAISFAGEKLAKLDPNWHSLHIEFEGYADHEPRLRPIADKEACRVEFDYRPKSVILVGPKVGNVDLTKEVFAFIPEPVVALMRMCDVLKDWHHTLKNPQHVIELVDGKTIILFENCTAGVVRNVRPSEGDAFDVESLPGEIPLDESDQAHFTRASLLEGFEVDGYYGQPVSVNYFPLLPKNGVARNNVDDLREEHRISMEKWEAERPQREAEEAARRAAREAEERAAYEALSPEEKALRDKINARFARQAELARAFLSVIPGPGE